MGAAFVFFFRARFATRVMSTLVRITQRRVKLNKGGVVAVLDAVKAFTACADVQVGCRVTSSRQLAALNWEYRQKRGPTDCLSFTARQWGPVPERLIPNEGDGGEVDVGDIFLAADRIEADASKLGQDREARWRLLLVHSFLHLLGHDHETDAAHAVMEARQQEVLAALAGLDLPRITVEEVVQPGSMTQL